MRRQFKFHCPNCGQRFAATFDQAGTASRCHTCQQEIMVPIAPSWLKVCFAKQIVPSLFTENPAALIRASHSEGGLNVLKSTWNDFAQNHCEPHDYSEPEGLAVSSLRDGGMLFISITFPKAYRESEAFYGIAVLTPPPNTKLTNETLHLATKRYFLLSLYSEKTIIEEAVEGKIYSHGNGCPADDPHHFLQWARQAYGLQDEAPITETIAPGTPSEMALNTAHAAARSTLDHAIRCFMAGEYETFSVKFPIIEGEYKEHLWLGNLTCFEDGSFSGVIEDHPKIIKSVVQGQTCQISQTDITDWQSFHQGKIHGNYSLRALIPTLSAEEAVKYHAILAELPA